MHVSAVSGFCTHTLLGNVLTKGWKGEIKSIQILQSLQKSNLQMLQKGCICITDTFKIQARHSHDHDHSLPKHAEKEDSVPSLKQSQEIWRNII